MKETSKTGLVLEGGGLRGMFTCGVLDVMMDNGITFDGAVGVSAGAAFGVNIKSGQRVILYCFSFSQALFCEALMPNSMSYTFSFSFWVPFPL